MVLSHRSVSLFVGRTPGAEHQVLGVVYIAQVEDGSGEEVSQFHVWEIAANPVK